MRSVRVLDPCILPCVASRRKCDRGLNAYSRTRLSKVCDRRTCNSHRHGSLSTVSTASAPPLAFSFFFRADKMSLVKPLVTVGPSGVGKSTLVKMLMAAFTDRFGTFSPFFRCFDIMLAFVPSTTTRAPRAGEIDGVHYNFVTKDKMLEVPIA